MKKSSYMSALLVSVLPMLIGLVLWKQLPAELAVHFNFQGVADTFASKTIVVFGLPLLFIVVLGFLIFAMSQDPKHQNIGHKPSQLVIWIIALIGIFVQCGIYTIALGYHIDIAMLTYFVIGLVFIFLGNYLPKTKQNYTVGLRLPWTLHSSENWNRTHRFGGYIFILTGVMIFLCGFFHQQVLFLICIFAPAIFVIVYSYLLYRKGI